MRLHPQPSPLSPARRERACPEWVAGLGEDTKGSDPQVRGEGILSTLARKAGEGRIADPG
jgi:hypothetical protein